jgi:RHS repeat-associated protein
VDNTLASPESTLFSYDSRDQLVQVIRGPPGSETTNLGEFDYNYQGLRVRHINSSRGDITYYYDNKSIIEERNDSDALVAHYRYADRLLSLDTGSSTQYYHEDALGSTTNLTDDSGNNQVSYKLDPWGHIREQQGTSVNRQVFTGQEHDENTGLIYFGARYYDPDTARFITQDSYLGEPNTPPSLHRYLYAYANPTVYVDLYGYCGFIMTPEGPIPNPACSPTAPPVNGTGCQ